MLERDEIVITRVGNGWELRPDYSRSTYPSSNAERAVAMTVADLTGIVRNWASLQLAIEKKGKAK